MGRSSSPEKKAYFQIFAWTFTILAILPCINFLIIISSVGSGIEIPFAREIASAEETPAPTEDMHSPNIQLNCKNLSSKLSFSTKAPTARLSFEGCKSVSRIVNKTNKSQGDVFALNDNQWTSDFIFLHHGPNKLKVSLDGKSYPIEITREVIKISAAKKAL